jgi:hypothetical protein
MKEDDRGYGFSILFPEWLISAATLIGGPITGFLLIHKNFLELRDYAAARRALVIGYPAILAYYALVSWISYRFYGMEFAGYAKIIPPVALQAVIVFSQRDKLMEFLAGGALRQSVFSAGKYVLYGSLVEAALCGAAVRMLPNMRGEKTVTGASHHELYYSGMDEKEAAALADDLVSVDHFAGPRQVFLRAEKEANGYRLFFPIKRSAIGDLESLSYYSLLLEDLEALHGKPMRGCFMDNAYALKDTVCFDKAAVPRLAFARNRKLAASKEVLAKVEEETDYFIALFEEASGKKKQVISFERVPTLYIFAANGIGFPAPDHLTHKVIESYGGEENAELALRILGNAFRGIEWRKADNLWLEYLPVLRQVRRNLESML